MSLPLVALAVVALLWAGYRVYGRFVARQFALSDGAVTPAVAFALDFEFMVDLSFASFMGGR